MINTNDAGDDASPGSAMDIDSDPQASPVPTPNSPLAPAEGSAAAETFATTGNVTRRTKNSKRRDHAANHISLRCSITLENQLVLSKWFVR